MHFADQSKNFKLYKKIGGVPVWQLKGSPDTSPFFYETGMSIDFDGAPDAYAPRGSGLPAKDNLGNAVAVKDKAGHSPWLVPPKKQTDPPTNPQWTPTFSSTVREGGSGESYEQKEGKYAGYYISTTPLHDIFHKTAGKTQTDPEYQTDANVYPYLAMPYKTIHSTGAHLGDYILAIHGSTGDYAFGLYADTKNQHVLGESSSALAHALNVRSDRHGGTSKGIVYLFFPNSGLGSEMRPALTDVEPNGLRWLKMYDDRDDLVAQVTTCFSPEYPGVARAFKKLGL